MFDSISRKSHTQAIELRLRVPAPVSGLRFRQRNRRLISEAVEGLDSRSSALTARFQARAQSNNARKYFIVPPQNYTHGVESPEAAKPVPERGGLFFQRSTAHAAADVL